MQGAGGLILRHPDDAARVKRLAGMIDAAVGRGGSVTERLLAFARSGEINAEPVEPAPLLAGLSDLLGHTLGAAVSVRLDVPDSLPRLKVDKGQLETVLVNLATNARDAMLNPVSFFQS